MHRIRRHVVVVAYGVYAYITWTVSCILDLNSLRLTRGYRWCMQIAGCSCSVEALGHPSSARLFWDQRCRRLPWVIFNKCPIFLIPVLNIRETDLAFIYMSTKEVKFELPQDAEAKPPKEASKIFIAVAGAPGSGKSSFIKKVTEKDVSVGDDLSSM